MENCLPGLRIGYFVVSAVALPIAASGLSPLVYQDRRNAPGDDMNPRDSLNGEKHLGITRQID
jgi:hypothetical protein